MAPAPRRVLVLCLLLWSASLAATACANSLPAVLFSRACFGLASACAMPAVSSMASAWVPAAIKASVIAFIYFCFNMGAPPALVAQQLLPAGRLLVLLLWSAACLQHIVRPRACVC